MKIEATVQRGKHKGKPLYPHRHEDGFYVVSPTRFEKDYVRVGSLTDVANAVRHGLRLRMSNPAEGIRAASLVAPVSIRIAP